MALACAGILGVIGKRWRKNMRMEVGRGESRIKLGRTNRLIKVVLKGRFG